MSLDLSQLLKQGPVRDLVLGQVAKQFGLSNETSGNLLSKGLSMVLGGMTKKASSVNGATGLFDLIKNTNIQGNPLDIISGKGGADSAHLLEVGKNLLPSLFGERTEEVAASLANSTNTNTTAAKGMLGMMLPVAFSFFKSKILGGLGLGGFTKLLGEQTQSLASHLDSQSLSALGFAGGSLENVLGGLNKVGASLGATAATGAAAVAATQQKAKSGLAKWLIPAGVILAALFGIKSCNGNEEKVTNVATPAQQVESSAQQTTPVVEANETVSAGLGDLAWNKSENDFTLSGTVPNAETKANLLDAFKGLAGNLPLVDKLGIDANAPKFGFDNFAGLVDGLKDFPNVNGQFADTVFNLAGQVANGDAKAALVDKAKAVLGDAFSINADNVSFDAVKAAVSNGLGNLAWEKSANDLAVSGTVQNEGTKNAILDAFKGLAGNLPLVDKLGIDANAPEFGFNNFAGLVESVKDFPAVNGKFADTVFNLVGQVPSADAKNALVEKAKAVLGDAFSINSDSVSIANAENAAQAQTEAQEADVIADMSLSKLDLDIVFATGSSEIDARYFRRLNAFAQFLMENQRGGEIAGYTDNVGNAANNQALSEKRANAVRAYLVQQGVPAERLTAVGYGEADPIADNTTAEGRAKNRRIEFIAK